MKNLIINIYIYLFKLYVFIVDYTFVNKKRANLGDIVCINYSYYEQSGKLATVIETGFYNSVTIKKKPIKIKQEGFISVCLLDNPDIIVHNLHINDYHILNLNFNLKRTLLILFKYFMIIFVILAIIKIVYQIITDVSSISTMNF